MGLLPRLRSGEMLLMDGAMGSELYQAGLEWGECAVEWNLSHPERVRAIHEEYARAGARCLLANTFQANPCALVPFALEARLEKILFEGIRLAAEVAAEHECFLLAPVGPIMIQGWDEEFPEWDDLELVLQGLTQPGLPVLDGILFETCSSPRALSAVAWTRRWLGYEGPPLLLSLTYRKLPDGSLVTYSGHSPETYARHAALHGVDALGVNCGHNIGMEEVLKIVRRYRAVCDLPLFARPNAGSPTQEEHGWAYPREPEDLVEHLTDLHEAGIRMIGGCCGTTPRHIAALHDALLARELAHHGDHTHATLT